MAAKEEGDARYALDLLKNAGELAFDEDSNIVESDHVKRAKERIEHNKVSEIISTLPLQQQRVLESILNLTNLLGWCIDLISEKCCKWDTTFVEIEQEKAE